jgi:hypothetical protein
MGSIWQEALIKEGEISASKQGRKTVYCISREDDYEKV